MTAIIGTANGKDIAVDIESLLGSHACIIANSGGGKSSLIRKMLEVTHGHVQNIVLDVEDDFYTLRERFDYVIAGGEEGDTPATLDNARSLALASLTHGFSLIVQLNDLGADAPEFINRFLGGLMSAPRELWHPVLVTIDELQRFASRDAGESIPAIKDLVFRGRKRGFTARFASLRMAEIDPGIRGMVNNWLLGRNGQALDRRTMGEQLGFSAKDAREKLATIDKRHFWAMGPAFSVEPVLIKVGNVETTPLRTGQARVATPPPPEALRGILAGLAVAAPADEMYDESVQLNKLPETDNSGEILKLRERIRRVEADNQALEQERDALRRTNDIISGQISAIRDVLARNETHKPAPTPVAAPPAVREPAPAREKPVTPKPAARAVIDGKPSPAALAISRLLDRINPARVTWAQAASMTGRKASGGNFNAARKWLRESGRLIEEGDVIRSAQEPKSGMTRAEAIDLWKSVLSNPAPRMIDAMLEWEEPDTKERLGADLGAAPRGGNFNNGLSQLRRNGLLYEYGSGAMKLADKLPGERDGGRG